MVKKKVLLIGNYSCVNRGDAAILDGLINGIEELRGAELDITATSVHSFESNILFNYSLQPDISSDIKSSFWNRISILKRIFNKFFLFYDILFLVLCAKYNKNYVSKKFVHIKNQINQYDIIIQVGGSYFLDLYTSLKYVSPAIAIILNKPVYLAGHSVGPFESRKSRVLTRLLFEKIDGIYLRENESMKHINNLKGKFDNVKVSTDTAWLIGDNRSTEIFRNEVETKKPIIAITVRDLKPFDRRLGISQDEYELLYVDVLNDLIDKGYHIIGVSMGTGLGNYRYDDRMSAQRIKMKLKNPDEMSVLLNEYNHLEIGYILSQCVLLIGTRLHSVILSMRYNTPAIAIFYEHKSLGILTKMNFKENSFFIKDIGSTLFENKVNDILTNQKKYKNAIAINVDKERQLAKQMIDEIFN